MTDLPFVGLLGLVPRNTNSAPLSVQTIIQHQTHPPMGWLNPRRCPYTDGRLPPLISPPWCRVH